MKYILLFFWALLVAHTGKAQILKAKDGTTAISFFSKAPLENIEATTKNAIIILNTITNDLQVRISVQNFKFKNALMEENFNENYLETEKFPNAVFIGKINEKPDYSKEGEIKITVTGKMDIHGVTKEETYQGIIKKNGNEFELISFFKIKLADFNIKIPSLYIKNIAEVVDIEVKTILEPFQKK